MGAFRLWPFLSIIASGLVPDAILILLCEVVEAGSHKDPMHTRGHYVQRSEPETLLSALHMYLSVFQA